MHINLDLEDNVDGKLFVSAKLYFAVYLMWMVDGEYFGDSMPVRQISFRPVYWIT